MILTGHVENGMIVLDNGTPLPEGAKVRVELYVPPEEQAGDESAAPEEANRGEMLDDLLQGFAGIVDDMPSDLARNHDHYLYGTPKK